MENTVPKFKLYVCHKLLENNLKLSQIPCVTLEKKTHSSRCTNIYSLKGTHTLNLSTLLP